MRGPVALSVTCTVFIACSGEHVSEVSPDASVNPDASSSNSPADAGPPDASPSPDAAEAGDAGVDAGSDADASVDAGSASDAGRQCTNVAGDHYVTLMYGGNARDYYVHIPPQYDCAEPMAVVFNFHGFLSNAMGQMTLTGMSTEADAQGFIVVYPDGYQESWNAGACCGLAETDNVDDVGFTRTVLAQVEQAYNVDPRRVFTTGFSNGGFFSHRLGCEAADVFAAIAPVSGVMGIPTCSPVRTVPIIDFHGTADVFVPYNGGGFLNFESVAQTMSGWAQRDGCSLSETILVQTGDTSCATYDGCPSGITVELCTVDGGTHDWPGGPTEATSIPATGAIWSFFVAHPMPDGG
jgi:polyhydroxybutyrate depolymerase